MTNVRIDWARRSLGAICIGAGFFACIQISCVTKLEVGGNGVAGAGGTSGAGGDSMSSSSSGGGGSGGGCTPGSKKTCYSGPPETTNIGKCKPGKQTCLADGTGYGVCEGEVVPTLEACATPEDDDCDGTAAPACNGAPLWTYTPGSSSASPNDDAIFSVALTPDGGYVIAGMVDGKIGADGFSPDSISPAGKAYIAKLDANKAVIWEKKYSAVNYAVARSVAVDKDGNVVVVGSFSGDMMIEGNTMLSTTTDIFIVKLDPLGTAMWSRSISSTKTQNAVSAAVDSAGNIFMTGSTDDPVDFGGGTLPVTGTDFFMASYTPDSQYRWSKLYANSGNQFGRAITTTSNGDVVVIGDSDSDTDLGAGVITKGGNLDIFVARYHNNDGAYTWGKLFGKLSDQVGRGIAASPDGNVLITGGFTGTIDWGGNLMSTAVGTSDVYVAKLDGMTGGHLAHAQGGKTGTSTGTSIGTDAAGNVTVFGHFNGSIDFGGQAVTSSPSSYDTFLVKLNGSDWKPMWTKPFGKAGNQYGWDVAVAKDGSALVGGGFNQEFEVPPNAIVPSTGGMDLFAVLLNP